MLLHEYEMQYNVKSVSDLEVYCGLEGLDPINRHKIRRHKKGNLNSVKTRSCFGCLFQKLMEQLKLSGLLNPRY